MGNFRHFGCLELQQLVTLKEVILFNSDKRT